MTQRPHPFGLGVVDGLDRFLEGVRALARFDQHPGIVTVKSFFRAHGTGYCLMDYVEGLALKQYLGRQPGGRIPVEQAWQLLTPVMDALRTVHKEGLLHRDLAPDNIYITRQGRVMLLDFGAARYPSMQGLQEAWGEVVGAKAKPPAGAPPPPVAPKLLLASATPASVSVLQSHDLPAIRARVAHRHDGEQGMLGGRRGLRD